MRKFSVNVNGNNYIVEIEELDGGAEVAAPVTTAPKTDAPKAAAKTATPAGATVIKAPFPGTVVKVNVTAGQAVKKGDVVAIIEAMKMENEISATIDGTIASVNVQKGASVATDDVIVSIK